MGDVGRMSLIGKRRFVGRCATRRRTQRAGRRGLELRPTEERWEFTTWSEQLSGSGKLGCRHRRGRRSLSSLRMGCGSGREAEQELRFGARVRGRATFAWAVVRQVGVVAQYGVHGGFPRRLVHIVSGRA